MYIIKAFGTGQQKFPFLHGNNLVDGLYSDSLQRAWFNVHPCRSASRYYMRAAPQMQELFLASQSAHSTRGATQGLRELVRVLRTVLLFHSVEGNPYP